MEPIDDLLEHNRDFATRFTQPKGSPAPARRLAVLACMDGRIDLYAILGLGVGDAHVVRNAGGLATDDAIRSLALSQHLLGTEEVIVIQHTDCGLQKTTDEDFAARVERATGKRPPWPALAFSDLEQSVPRLGPTAAPEPVAPARPRARFRLRGRERQAARGRRAAPKFALNPGGAAILHG